MKNAIYYLVLILVMQLSVWACAPPGEPAAPTKETGVPERPAKLPWEAAWEKTLTSGRQEGKVVVYTTSPLEIRTGLVGFSNKYGIELDFISGRSAELLARISAERRAGLYLADVFLAGSSSCLQAKDAGFLQPVEPALILPEVIDGTVWQDGHLPFGDSDKLTLSMISHVNTPIIINAPLVSPPLRSLSDLLDTRWKGKILVGDPTVSGSGIGIITAIGELHGENAIRQLARQEPAIVRDPRTLVEWVARGKNPIGVGSSAEIVSEFVRMGAPIAAPLLADLNIVSSSNGDVALLERASHPSAARVFVNWLLTREGQTAYVKAVSSQSRRLDVTTEYIAPERVRQSGVKYLDIDAEEVVLKKPYYMKLSGEIFGQFLK